jgi:hypothetical protein
LLPRRAANRKAAAPGQPPPRPSSKTAAGCHAGTEGSSRWKLGATGLPGERVDRAIVITPVAGRVARADPPVVRSRPAMAPAWMIDIVLRNREWNGSMGSVRRRRVRLRFAPPNPERRRVILAATRAKRLTTKSSPTAACAELFSVGVCARTLSVHHAVKPGLTAIAEKRNGGADQTDLGGFVRREHVGAKIADMTHANVPTCRSRCGAGTARL